ncbi:MAG: helix-turn-helix transcriptional regulator [Chitinophagaceae bacterium]
MFCKKEIEFLQLICTDLTYEQIADKIELSKRQVDALREKFFLHYDIQSRQALANASVMSGTVVL